MTLVNALVAMADRPWCERNHDKALTQNGLARRLKLFSVRPKNIGPEHSRFKGYSLEALSDAFARYCPDSGFQSAHPYRTHENNGLDEKQSAHQKSGCAAENQYNKLNLNEMYGCADENPESSASNEWEVEI